jgi:hypothetical protein
MSISKKTRRKRLRKLASKIVKHEDKFDMHDWFSIDMDADLSAKEAIAKVIEKRRPICGTSGCAAGWAVIMFGTREQIKRCMKSSDRWADVAQELLGMDDDEANLFGRTSYDAHEVADELRQMANA